MKISGSYSADSLNVLEARPKTTYLVRFRDTGSGRTFVYDLITDPVGGGTLRAPVRWGLNNYQVTAQIIGEEPVNFSNQPGDDEYVVFAPTPQPPVEPVPIEGGN